MNMRAISVILTLVPICILGQEISSFNAEIVRGINELRIEKSILPVVYNENLVYALKEFELSPELVEKRDSIYIYNVLNRNMVYDFNFEFIEFKIFSHNYSKVLNALDQKANSLIMNRNIQNVGLITSESLLSTKVKIIGTENYISLNEEKLAELLIRDFDGEIIHNKVKLSGKSKTKNLYYYLSDEAEFKSTSQAREDLNELTVLQDSSFLIEISFPQNSIEINNSLYILDSSLKTLLFYKTR